MQPFTAHGVDLMVDQLQDIEDVRKACENRLRQLTRTETDKDGEERGLGLAADHPIAVNLTQQVEVLKEEEAALVKGVQKGLKEHPLYKWIKSTSGVGEKQAARLLGALAWDPYWNFAEDRPRTVRELWSFSGLRTDDNGQAVRRRKGQQSNWSTAAKTRAYLIAESCLKAKTSPYNAVYYKRKEHTEGRTHVAPCPQCDGAGSKKTGTPWKDGHRHADALRYVSKQLLKDLWTESRDLHAGVTR